MNDDAIFEAVQEEAAENTPATPYDLTPEFEIIAQQVDPAEMNELELHICNPPGPRESPYGECELGSCKKPPSHYVEMLSGRIFFGCEEHVDNLIKMRVAMKKRVFETWAAK